MKSKHILIAILGVASIIGLLVFKFYEPKGPITTLTADQQQGYALLAMAERVCLAGESDSATLGLSAVVEAQSASVDASAFKQTLRGAVGYASEQIRALQDTEVRQCLEARWPKIEACLTDNCASADVSDITFQFTYDVAAAADSVLDHNHVAFGRQFRDPKTTLVKQVPGEYFPYNMGLPRRGQEVRASIHRVVRDGYLPQRRAVIELCLMQAEPLPLGAQTYTRYLCSEAAGTCAHDPSSPPWLKQCPAPAPENGPGAALLPAFLNAVTLSAPAYAQAPQRAVWHVPSLETLAARDDLVGQGYTVFNLATEAPISLDADGFFVSLSINGQPLYLDGMAPSYAVQPFSPGSAFRYEFALQNLNFAGAAAGCDTIDATIRFVKDGKLTRDRISMSRSYVALRDARRKTMAWGDTTLVWTGRYMRAPREYDNEVFANSIFLSNSLDGLNDQDRMTTAKVDIVAMKNRFDRLALTHDGMPLVAVIRPPLTKTSYGLAIGKVQPTGQIAFTYSREGAGTLLNYLLAQRDESAAHRRAIRHDSFIYSLRGDNAYAASPPVCADDHG